MPHLPPPSVLHNHIADFSIWLLKSAWTSVATKSYTIVQKSCDNFTLQIFCVNFMLSQGLHQNYTTLLHKCLHLGSTPPTQCVKKNIQFGKGGLSLLKSFRLGWFENIWNFSIHSTSFPCGWQHFYGIVPSEGKPHGIVPKEKCHEKKYNNTYINTSNLWLITEVNMHWEHWENQIKM